ncbi:MAG TPA: hypothetical protein VHW05_03780 [Phenylobacterium sp.]|jgi:hypothetical protein|nr:hypothetical protein [Phenylobacterium sp.]
MVNATFSVELTGQARGGVAILHAQLAPRAVAIGVDGRLRHAELAGDLLGRQVLIDQPQAFTFAGGQQPHWIFGDDIACAHDGAS